MPADESPGSTRPLRADARRNRERVLAAAREAFAAEGLSVPLDEIARRAGVGPGTVYRHFPTKEALFHAAILDNMERMIAVTNQLADADDPGRAFFGYLDDMFAESTLKRELADAVGAHMSPEYMVPQRDLIAGIDVLLRRAQDAGAVRGELTIEDLMLLLKGIFAATVNSGDAQRRRAFTVILDGLRAR